MGKGGSFNITRHGGANARGPGMRCVKCGVTIFYGERCTNCQRELRQRKRRKPR